MRPLLKLIPLFKFFTLILIICFLTNSGVAALRIPSSSQRICSYVLSDESVAQFGKPDPNYNLKKDLDLEKSIVMEDVKTLDQGKYGCCWISSYLGYVGRRECSTVVKDLNPSQTYLAVMSLIDRAINGIRFRQTVSQGGNTPYAIELTERYGLIPEGVWKPKINIHEEKMGDQFVDLLNVKIAKYVRETESISSKIFPTKADQKALSEKESAMVEEFADLFNKYIGALPESFNYEGKTFTPIEFGKLALPQDMREMDFVDPVPASKSLPSLNTEKTVYPKPNFNNPEMQIWEPFLKNFKKDAKWEAVDDAIERSLRSKEPVLFGIGIKRSFIDSERGLISIDAFAKGQEGFLEEIQNAVGAMPSYTDGGHAILITGIYRNTEGKVLGYRIQNSWGEKGDHGYFDMDANYMHTFNPSFFFKKGMFKP